MANAIFVTEIVDPHINAADRKVAGAIGLTVEEGLYFGKRFESDRFECEVAFALLGKYGLGHNTKSCRIHIGFESCLAGEG